MAYPIVAATSTGKASAAALHFVELPDGSAAGSKLLLLVSEDATTDVAFAFLHEVTQGEVDDNDEFENGQFGYSPSAGASAAWIVRRVTGWTGNFALSTIANDTSTHPNPTSVTAPWGVRDNLFVSGVAWRGNISHTAYGYSANQSTDRLVDSVEGIGIASSTRDLHAASDDPGADTLAATAAWGAYTIVLEPSVSGGIDHVKNVSDPIVLGEVETNVAHFVRSFSDPIALGDTESHVAAFIRVFSDAIALGESNTNLLAIVKSVSDAIVLGDSSARVAAFAKAVSDAIALGDSQSFASAIGKAVSDSVALSESLSITGAFAKAVTDAITLGDSKSTVGVFFRAFADAMAMGDAKGSSQLIGFYQAAADALALGESLATARTLGKSVSDGLAVVETLYPLRSAVKDLEARIELGDSATTAFAKAVSDAIVIGESVDTSRAGAKTRAVSEALSLGETVATVQAIAKSVADAVTLGERVVPAGSGTILLAVSDGISLGEVISPARAIVFAVSDGLELDAGVDGGLAGTALSKPVTDPIVLGEHFRVRLGGGWFGPDGPCECGCECTCDEARADYGHEAILVLRSKGGQTYNSHYHLYRICQGDSVTPVTWNFPGGIEFDTASIAADNCATEVSVRTEVPDHEVNGTLYSGWGGSTTSFATGCLPIAVLVAYSGSPPFVKIDITLTTILTYECVDGVYDYRLKITASYLIHNPVFATASYPQWTWVESPAGSYTGTRTIAGVEHIFKLDRLFFTSELSHQIYLISLSAAVRDPITSVTLGAPPYDPFGFLVGTAAVA